MLSGGSVSWSSFAAGYIRDAAQDSGRPHYRGCRLRTDTRNAFRAFRRGSRVAKPSFALGVGLHVADFRLRFNRLGLRIADRLGQHLKQLRLGRFGRRCHLATISRSIVRNFSRRRAALSRIPLMPSVYRRAERLSQGLVALGPSLFYRS